MRQKEVWKDIPDYVGFYQASSFGRIKSLPRTTTKGGIMKPYINRRNGYAYISLCKDNIAITHRVHKLVYSAFMGGWITSGYDKEKTINHKDGNKANNALANLEIISQRDNQVHAYELGLQPVAGLCVIRIDDGKVYNTATDAARDIGGRQGEMVSRVCRGERSHYRGKKYAFYKDFINGTVPKFIGRNTRKASEVLWQ